MIPWGFIAALVIVTLRPPRVDVWWAWLAWLLVCVALVVAADVYALAGSP